MRLFLAIAVLAPFLAVPCLGQCDASPPNCEALTSEYEKYRECMEHQRSKRSACNNECDTSSEDCDDNCCESSRTSCTTYSCCHRTCRADCRTSSCRTSCRKKCQNKDTDNPTTTEAGAKILESDSKLNASASHNITTIIHLNNIINNTNLITLPVNLNNTNVNNVTFDVPPSSVTETEWRQPPLDQTLVDEEKSVSGEEVTPKPSSVVAGKEKCCLTVGPKQCVPQEKYPFMRCFHLRKKACGFMCTAPVVHYQRHEVCDGEEGGCREQMVYVPQPRPRCSFQPTWPYVNCARYETPPCEGCFDHGYGAGRCAPFCYEEGYGQAAGYRPQYAPPCYQTGMCGEYDFQGEMSFKSAFPAVESQNIEKVDKPIVIEAKVPAKGAKKHAQIIIVPKEGTDDVSTLSV